MKITLKNVRLSFPNLWKPKSINGSDPKFGASFLLSKENDADQITALREACKSIAKEQWPDGIPKGVVFCVKDGTDKDYDGYGEGVIYVSANSDKRPSVVDRDRTTLVEEDGRPYAGCIVNASIRLWVQSNTYGKRVNAQLQGIQFVKDGDSFGEKPFNADEEFEDLGGSDKPASRGNAAVGVPEDDDIPFAPNHL